MNVHSVSPALGVWCALGALVGSLVPLGSTPVSMLSGGVVGLVLGRFAGRRALAGAARLHAWLVLRAKPGLMRVSGWLALASAAGLASTGGPSWPAGVGALALAALSVASYCLAYRARQVEDSVARAQRYDGGDRREVALKALREQYGQAQGFLSPPCTAWVVSGAAGAALAALFGIGGMVEAVFPGWGGFAGVGAAVAALVAVRCSWDAHMWRLDVAGATLSEVARRPY